MFRLAALCLLATAGSAMAGPHGKVERIERISQGSPVMPRLCQLGRDNGRCVGEEPRAGDIVTVLDETHVIGTVMVVSASPMTQRCGNLWTIATRQVTGTLGDNTDMGVIDPALDPAHARIIPDSQLPHSPGGSDEAVFKAIDRDGDGNADIIVTTYTCDANGIANTSAQSNCVDVWSRTRSRFIKAAQLNFAQCGF